MENLKLCQCLLLRDELLVLAKRIWKDEDDIIIQTDVWYLDVYSVSDFKQIQQIQLPEIIVEPRHAIVSKSGKVFISCLLDGRSRLLQ